MPFWNGAILSDGSGIGMVRSAVVQLAKHGVQGASFAEGVGSRERAARIGVSPLPERQARTGRRRDRLHGHGRAVRP